MRHIKWGILLAGFLVGSASAQSPAAIPGRDCHTTLFGGTSCDQSRAVAKPKEAKPGAGACRLGTDAFARLACADAKLAASRAQLERTYQSAKESAGPNGASALAKQQLGWIRERNQKCGIEAKDQAPLSQLRPAAKCLEDEINARIAALNNAARQTSGGPGPCRSSASPYDRLVCANPDLAQLNLALRKALERARGAASPSDRERLNAEQANWIKARDEKCGLSGNDPISIDELQKSKPCIEQEIKGQLVALADDLKFPAIEQSAPASIPEIVIEPLLETGTPGREVPAATSHIFRLSAVKDGIKGQVQCSVVLERSAEGSNDKLLAKGHVKIGLEENMRVVHLLETDTWRPVWDKIRSAAQSSCNRALAAESQRIGSSDELFEISVEGGVFTASSIGASAAWTVQANVPKEMDKIKTALGVTDWVELTRLARNPYYYKDALVAVVAKFEQKLSETEAIFTYEGSEIVISSSPTELSDGQPMVLAARVKGNKGVIKPSGDEVLLPAAVYVGSTKCTSSCETIAKLAALRNPPELPIEVSR